MTVVAYNASMNRYLDSFKMLMLAILAIFISFLWGDAAPVGFLAFLTFTFLAAQSAYKASKTFKSKARLLTVFSAILGLLVFIGFTVMNPPQCPDNYTQQQIDAANGNCIIGANIGIGLYFMFIVFPTALLIVALWIHALLSARKHNSKN